MLTKVVAVKGVNTVGHVPSVSSMTIVDPVASVANAVGEDSPEHSVFDVICSALACCFRTCGEALEACGDDD